MANIPAINYGGQVENETRYDAGAAKQAIGQRGAEQERAEENLGNTVAQGSLALQKVITENQKAQATLKSRTGESSLINYIETHPQVPVSTLTKGDQANGLPPMSDAGITEAIQAAQISSPGVKSTDADAIVHMHDIAGALYKDQMNQIDQEAGQGISLSGWRNKWQTDTDNDHEITRVNRINKIAAAQQIKWLTDSADAHMQLAISQAQTQHDFQKPLDWLKTNPILANDPDRQTKYTEAIGKASDTLEVRKAMQYGPTDPANVETVEAGIHALSSPDMSNKMFSNLSVDERSQLKGQLQRTLTAWQKTAPDPEEVQEKFRKAQDNEGVTTVLDNVAQGILTGDLGKINWGNVFKYRDPNDKRSGIDPMSRGFYSKEASEQVFHLMETALKQNDKAPESSDPLVRGALTNYLLHGDPAKFERDFNSGEPFDFKDPVTGRTYKGVDINKQLSTHDYGELFSHMLQNRKDREKGLMEAGASGLDKSVLAIIRGLPDSDKKFFAKDDANAALNLAGLQSHLHNVAEQDKAARLRANKEPLSPVEMNNMLREEASNWKPDPYESRDVDEQGSQIISYATGDTSTLGSAVGKHKVDANEMSAIQVGRQAAGLSTKLGRHSLANDVGQFYGNGGIAQAAVQAALGSEDDKEPTPEQEWGLFYKARKILNGYGYTNPNHDQWYQAAKQAQVYERMRNNPDAE